MLEEILNGAKSAIKIGISFKSRNIRISNEKSVNEIILPTRASIWEDQVLVDVNNIKSIHTKSDFDYYLILDMYDGRTISIEYSFSSDMKKDVDKLMKMRSGCRPSQGGIDFHFKF